MSFPKNISVETSTIADGNMDFRFGTQEKVLHNLERFLEKNGLSYRNCIPMRSDHKDIIKVVDKETTEAGPLSREESIEADVLVTQEKEITLLLTTADCQPVSFYDSKTETIALAHISRHTLDQMLAEKTYRFFSEHFKTDPKDLLVHIGPHIQKESYKFPLPFSKISPVIKSFIEEKDGFGYIDMASACTKQLTEAGIKESNITVSKKDTVTSPDFFSHYRSAVQKTFEGRMATIITKK